MKILIPLLFFCAVFSVKATESTIKTDKTRINDQLEDRMLSQHLLKISRSIQKKIKVQQDYTLELEAISEEKKLVEMTRLIMAMEFTKQQAALTDKASLDVLEMQRKAMNTRFNEIIRLIDQVEKNQETVLLSEKLNELIVFLEPAASAEAKSEAAKAPPKPLLRGAPLAKEKTTTPTKK